ncbi:hypothetical protein [Streptosporangium carneum]|uniref:Uncharacterized protein n=1 Tax=Streptosporangium carneum TaxID=47481 RepID=A0A9W6MH16_9ACTN|nr:hypothetical protein [Streptosporangium carneum]GLK14379.1 hypothetical protein GCM10017600_77910 [Streptosporangium carneum]
MDEKPRKTFWSSIRTTPVEARVVAAAMWLIGIVLTVFGVLGDLNGSWSDLPFSTNLLSALTGFLFAVPVVLLVFRWAEEYLKEQREALIAREESLQAQLAADRARMEEFLQLAGHRDEEARVAARREAETVVALAPARDAVTRMWPLVDAIFADTERSVLLEARLAEAGLLPTGSRPRPSTRCAPCWSCGPRSSRRRTSSL